MGRIQCHYERRFRALLTQEGRPNVQAEVAAIVASARKQSEAEQIPLSLALARRHADLVQRSGDASHFPQCFTCDVGLGGLARWLRGSGYQAFWNSELDDAGLIRDAQERGATLITTDSMMLERGILRDGLVPSVFVPSTLTREQQLEIIFRELGLSIRESRCMRCGGKLQAVDKSTVASRIPPKTALWLDEYFVCAACGRLFWRGTHWRQMQQRLARLP
jgi:uncharacterized protein with PIN domain